LCPRRRDFKRRERDLNAAFAKLYLGALLATATLPAADRLQDRVSPQIGLDAN
jgi:hypothetical protein